jgi:hypothetical protein
VLKYLAGYTHRVAISNHRLVSMRDGRVTFRYKDYADGQRQRTMSLCAEEFLRRFVQHVLPRCFVKIRHYGLLANCHRQVRLEVCRRLLLAVTATTILADAGSEPRCSAVEPAPRPQCPRCGSYRLLTVEVPRPGGVPVSGDTS